MTRTLQYATDYVGLPDGNYLPKTGWTAGQPSAWQIYSPDDVLYSNGSTDVMYREAGSEDMYVESLMKTGSGTTDGNTIAGIHGRFVDATHYVSFEPVFHDGVGIAGAPGPENAISFTIRNNSTYYEHKIGASFLPETYYKLGMEMIDDHYQCWIDDALIFDADFTAPEIAALAGGTKAGQINFVGFANFKNFSLYQSSSVPDVDSFMELEGSSGLYMLEDGSGFYQL